MCAMERLNGLPQQSKGRFGPAEVTAVSRLTPHMLRVTLKSEIARAYPSNAAGGHFKLVAPLPGQSAEAFAEEACGPNIRAATRTYTIRRARPEASEFDVDIVVHGDLGRVGPWAQRAALGDVVVVSSCGSPKLITEGVTRVLAACDLTGWPALAAGLETLGPDVRVEAYVETPGDADRQPVAAPPGSKFHWIVKPDPNAPADALVDAIKAAPRPGPSDSVFVAGEFTAVAALRQYFQGDLHVDRKRRYISSYWKVGVDEQAHKVAKAQVQD